jgi:hypothetical protein
MPRRKRLPHVDPPISLEEGLLLNTQQAARFLGVTPWCLEYWRSRTHADGPDFVKVGRLARYRLKDLQRYVRRRTKRMESSKGNS